MGALSEAAPTDRSRPVSFSILVVDDEPDIAELFRQRFRREVRDGSYVLHFANSGEEGLRRLGEIRTQLIVILSDINMPGTDGLELLRRAKTLRPELAVLFMTAYADDGRRQRAEELGAAGFLAKPVDFAELKVRLATLVHGSADG
jgi:CheY-like chemotaxis protein